MSGMFQRHQPTASSVAEIDVSDIKRNDNLAEWLQYASSYYLARTSYSLYRLEGRMSAFPDSCGRAAT